MKKIMVNKDSFDILDNRGVGEDMKTASLHDCFPFQCYIVNWVQRFHMICMYYEEAHSLYSTCLYSAFLSKTIFSTDFWIVSQYYYYAYPIVFFEFRCSWSLHIQTAFLSGCGVNVRLMAAVQPLRQRERHL